MITNETIGRIDCLVCGEPAQDVRINKNNNLYMICDNSCRVNFTREQSKKWLPLLKAGHDVIDGKILIKSTVNGVKQNEKQNFGTNETRTRRILSIKPTGTSAGSAAGTDTGRSDTIGRSSGASAAIHSAGNDKPKRGILAGFFDDDGDE